MVNIILNNQNLESDLETILGLSWIVLKTVKLFKILDGMSLEWELIKYLWGIDEVIFEEESGCWFITYTG